jgi:hypothetical protein
MRYAVVLAAALPLMGCAAAGPAITSLTTAGVAGSVGSATGSALAGVGAGVAVAYGTDQLVQYSERRLQDKQQQAIASAAAPLNSGQSAHWDIPGDGTIDKAAQLLLSGDKGTVEVAHIFGQAIPCKDVIFTVNGDHGIYTTTICKNDQGTWMWAAGEPSVHRWGYLQ